MLVSYPKIQSNFKQINFKLALSDIDPNLLFQAFFGGGGSPFMFQQGSGGGGGGNRSSRSANGGFPGGFQFNFG